eukprot:TRINITY_DN12296_c0_g1_i1.p1 TRINITY_DN12296_c0_g1~~TRINITY_DN12296_c0_g1_i1.p1  ORF type:complete len:512 (+),score=98.23 TRINITY_DN12296_c0_g1_i1:86-1537(+)
MCIRDRRRVHGNNIFVFLDFLTMIIGKFCVFNLLNLEINMQTPFDHAVPFLMPTLMLGLAPLLVMPMYVFDYSNCVQKNPIFRLDFAYGVLDCFGWGTVGFVVGMILMSSITKCKIRNRSFKWVRPYLRMMLFLSMVLGDLMAIVMSFSQPLYFVPALFLDMFAFFFFVTASIYTFYMKNFKHIIIFKPLVNFETIIHQPTEDHHHTGYFGTGIMLSPPAESAKPFIISPHTALDVKPAKPMEIATHKEMQTPKNDNRLQIGFGNLQSSAAESLANSQTVFKSDIQTQSISLSTQSKYANIHYVANCPCNFFFTHKHVCIRFFFPLYVSTYILFSLYILLALTLSEILFKANFGSVLMQTEDKAEIAHTTFEKFTITETAFQVLVVLQYTHKCLLRYLDSTYLPQEPLALLLPINQFLLSRVVASVALGQDVPLEHRDLFTRNDLRTKFGLDDDIKQLMRDVLLQPLAEMSPEVLSSVLMDHE